MASSKKKTAQPEGEAKRTRFQKFDAQDIARSQIKNATYNPRTITDRARKLLRDNMKANGLLGSIIWNKRTGNILGGHQRLAALDALEGNQTYTLTVDVVDLDDKTEKEQNIFLNNPTAQGDWDLKALEKMLAEDVNLENAGFSQSEIFQLFGDGALKGGTELTAELAEQVRLTQERFKKIRDSKGKNLDSPHFYSLLIFRNDAEREAFCKAIGVEDNRYLNGTEILEKLKAANVTA
ncbi:MAG: hypothetical protein JWR19_2173 [Pedosphaera sp.]|nr:hypothetical protein [Pedosphaera sp.]